MKGNKFPCSHQLQVEQQQQQTLLQEHGTKIRKWYKQKKTFFRQKVSERILKLI